MKDLPQTTAIQIYKKRYWERTGFGEVAKIYPHVAAELFDTGVNMGPAIASRFLQVALNGLNRNGADYADIAVDNDVGPVTLHALTGFFNKRGAAGEGVLLKALEVQQGARYLEIVGASPKQETFLYGWLANRIGL